MGKFALWLVSGRFRAGLMTAVLLPVFSVFSASIVTLIALQKGLEEGLKVLAMATAVWLGFSLAWKFLDLPVDLVESLGLAFLFLAPTMLLAGIVLRYRSLNLAWQVCAFFAALSIVVVFLFSDDVTGFWQMKIDKLVLTMSAEQGKQLVGLVADFPLGIAQGMMTAMVVIHGLMAFAVGTWWHRLLNGQVGIGKDFRRLRLGRMLTAVAVVALIFVGLTDSILADNVAFLFFLLFIVQGFSVVHYLTIEGGWHWLVLILSYVVFLTLPIGGPFFAAFGLVDNVMNTRMRLDRAR